MGGYGAYSGYGGLASIAADERLGSAVSKDDVKRMVRQIIQEEYKTKDSWYKRKTAEVDPDEESVRGLFHMTGKRSRKTDSRLH